MHHRAAVHHERLARDEIAVFGGKEEKGSDQIVRHRVTLDGAALDDQRIAGGPVVACA